MSAQIKAEPEDISSGMLSSQTDAPSYIHTTPSFNKLCDIQDWQDPRFLAIAADLMRTDIGNVPIHRKVWEFARVAWALQECGVWNDRSLGLSIAGGSERFLFYAANHILRMVSTDIYGVGDFAQKEADAAFVTNPAAYAPFPFRESHLQVGRMNALSQGFRDNLFDFTVSFSSIEHFGGLKNAALAIQEMVRVTRPGGVIAITTECSLNGFTTHESFTPRQIQLLVERSGCMPLGLLDFHLSEQSKTYLIDMKRDRLDQIPHLNLKIRAAIFTSVCLILRKPGSLVAAADTATRLGSIESAVQESLTQSPDTLLPRPSALQRVEQWLTNRLRAVRYRLEERCFEHRQF